jgi:septal ring factor EnvC (AmiA/AmiB activator)
VVAPFDGKVLFAGPFKGYGQILIIGHGDGYHSLLAGLDRVDESVGQWLVAGEPVGVMSQSSQKPRLYLELRHDGQPINPLPWLAIRDEKVNG